MSFRRRALTPFLQNVMAKAVASGVFMVGMPRASSSSRGVPVHLTQTNGEEPLDGTGPHPAAHGTDDDGDFSAAAEAGLRSDAPDIERQAERARAPETGKNILCGMSTGPKGVLTLC